ncbi:MAG: hypothetical protein J6A52_06905 [Bacilli bacterium]|nr:hypothetical protein [Bacilli bacterium]
MKNIIEYFYRIAIKKIVYKDDFYIIITDDSKYIFKDIDSNNIYFLKEIQKYYYNIFHRIILNFYNEVVTDYNGKKYILMKINVIENRNVNIQDIIYVSQLLNFNNGYLRDIDKLWKYKIDKFESYIVSKESDLPMREYYDYFIGLGENAIFYYGYVNKNKITYGFTYKRIYKEDTLYDLYDPTNIIVGPIVRGIAEYIKMSFFYGDVVSIDDILKINFNYDDAILFISRLLFPTYFFDLYKKDGCENIEKMKNIIFKSCSYEKYVYSIIEGLKKRQINLPQISWINN